MPWSCRWRRLRAIGSRYLYYRKPLNANHSLTTPRILFKEVFPAELSVMRQDSRVSTQKPLELVEKSGLGGASGLMLSIPLNLLEDVHTTAATEIPPAHDDLSQKERVLRNFGEITDKMHRGALGASGSFYGHPDEVDVIRIGQIASEMPVGAVQRQLPAEKAFAGVLQDPLHPFPVVLSKLDFVQNEGVSRGIGPVL